MQGSMALYTKSQRHKPLDVALILLGVYPTDTAGRENDFYARFFIPALLIFANKWKQISMAFYRRLNKLYQCKQWIQGCLPPNKQKKWVLLCSDLERTISYSIVYCSVKMLNTKQGYKMLPLVF